MESKRSHNLLIIEEDPPRGKRLQTILAEITAKYAAKNRCVFYVTDRPLDDDVSEVLRSNYDRDGYKKLFFFYSTSAEDILLKLDDVLSWHVTPSLVVIESIQRILRGLGVPVTATDKGSYQYSAFVAAVMDAVQVFSAKQRDHCQCILTASRELIDAEAIPLEMYFVKGNVIRAEELRSSGEVLEALRAGLA